jgi:predicted Ser/Thr protein kinase
MTLALCKIIKNEHIVKKVFKDTRSGRGNFFQELFFYLYVKDKNLDYIPKLIGYDRRNLTLELENVGTSLDNFNYRKSKRHYDPFIRELHKKLLDDTELYHNDIRYKNVCVKNDKYYLIDFENHDFKFKDKNHQKILTETYSE